MKSLSRLLAIGLTAFALAGCAGTPIGDNIRAAVSFVTTANAATVPPSVVLIAISTADGIIATGRNYVDPRRNKRCDGTNGPICRDPAITPMVNQIVVAVRTSRDNAKAFLRDHPNAAGEPGSGSAYDALMAAISNAQQVYSQYNIGVK